MGRRKEGGGGGGELGRPRLLVDDGLLACDCSHKLRRAIEPAPAILIPWAPAPLPAPAPNPNPPTPSPSHRTRRTPGTPSRRAKPPPL